MTHDISNWADCLNYTKFCVRSFSSAWLNGSDLSRGNNTSSHDLSLPPCHWEFEWQSFNPLVHKTHKAFVSCFTAYLLSKCFVLVSKFYFKLQVITFFSQKLVTSYFWFSILTIHINNETHYDHFRTLHSWLGNNSAHTCNHYKNSRNTDCPQGTYRMLSVDLSYSVAILAAFIT